MEYKIGDRVRIKKSYYSDKGGVGVIKKISRSTGSCWVVSDKNQFGIHHSADELTLLEDTMEEYTDKKGQTLEKVREITVKELILAGARDEDVTAIDAIVCNRADGWNGECSLYIPIPLKKIIDYASSCSDKLQWLVDKGFVKKVEEVTWKISINDGFCEYQYPVRISEKESIKSVYHQIRRLFSDEDRSGKETRRK